MKAIEEDAKVIDRVASSRGIGSSLRRAIEAVKGPASVLSGATRLLAGGWKPPRNRAPLRVQQRANRAAAADIDWFQGAVGAGSGWARSEYGEYYASSVSVYAAIRLRAESLSRPPLVVYRQSADGARHAVGPSHPVQRLMDRVNPWYTRGDLWRATEIYLDLWGSSFWALERNDEGQWEIWPLRPDRVSILADRRQYIRGFVYQGRTGPVAYTADEILWIRYFNPLEEHAGLSPMAPVRMAVDMGKDALRFNRNFLRNSAQPDFVLLTKEKMMPGLQVFPEGLPGKSRL
jgi:phage portal protein BeeE